MSTAEKAQKVEDNLVDHFPTKRHMRTGQDCGKLRLKHDDIDLGHHLGRLHISKKKGRNDHPETKLKAPKEKELQ